MANGYIDTKREAQERKLHIAMAVAGFILLAYICARCARYQVENAGIGLPEALVTILMNFGSAPFAFSFGTEFWEAFATLGILAAIVVWVAQDQKVLNRHYKDGEQSGTAAWQTPKSIQTFNRKYNAPYGKPIAEGQENLIYSKHCQLTMNTRQTNLNNNAMIIGGPGSGKSYNIVRPCLLQAYCSYVVTDPSGELLATTGKFFESQGYDIRVFNLTDMAHSHCYNPFCYLRGEEDVLTLITCLIKNTEGQ